MKDAFTFARENLAELTRPGGHMSKQNEPKSPRPFRRSTFDLVFAVLLSTPENAGLPFQEVAQSAVIAAQDAEEVIAKNGGAR